MDLRSVNSKYVLGERLGGGSFGDIYYGEHSVTHEQFAIKLERAQARGLQLVNEFRAYRLLAGGIGVPAVKWYGVEGENNVMVMDLLGKSLEGLYVSSGRCFSLKTVLMLADQLISRIEYLHSKGLIHRDIKPENFVMGARSHSNILYVIDLGLSKRFQDSKVREHIPFKDGRPLIGTARYTSISTHLGIEQSRRDDLEGIAYVLIYLLKGILPWMGLKGNRKEKYAAIAEKKISTPIEVLCEGVPHEFADFLTDVRALEFADAPDYARYRQRFRDLFVQEGFVFDCVYDWDLPEGSVGTPAAAPAQISEDVSGEDFRRPNPSAPLLPLVAQPRRTPLSRLTADTRAVRPQAIRQIAGHSKRIVVPTWVNTGPRGSRPLSKV